MPRARENTNRICLCNTSLNKHISEQNLINIFDKKTAARLERERQETVKGLLALRTREKLCKEQTPESREEDKLKNEKIHGERKEFEETPNETDKGYRLTKLSKFKILRSKDEKERTETCISRYKKLKFFTALIKLKTNFLRQEWNHTCHLKERTHIRKNIRLQKITGIRLKYNIDETLPPDSIIFDKIMKHKRERERQIQLRKERMIKIIEKITREMKNGIRLLKKPEIRSREIVPEEICEEGSMEMSIEEIQHEEQYLEYQSEIIEKDEEEEVSKDEEENFAKVQETLGDKNNKSSRKAKEEKNIETIKGNISTKKDNDFTDILLMRTSKLSTPEVYQEDTCFFANPSVVIFEDFKIDKKYSRKVTITNKTSKWAYVRFNQVYTEIWEPGVIEIDTMDAARVKPGLHVTINVKFSSVHEEIVIAQISFLTLSPDNPTNFHDFRIPVRCTPASPVPVLEPREIRFPTAPIWRYEDPKLSERTLTVSNDGEKSFSVLIGERDARNDRFLWRFDEAEAQSVKSSVSNESESDDVGENSLDCSTPRKTYEIRVPPGVNCRLKISFRPKYVGLHHEVIKIGFSSEEKIFHKQYVPVWAEVTRSQIHLDPPCIDLGIATIDTDVCQQNFQIVNTGRSSVEILMKTPKGLGQQVTVHPRSTIVPAESFSIVSVRLIPESAILNATNRFYDSTSSMLEFPIQVQSITQDTEKPPPLTLKVLANLTTTRGLVLEPGYVDLGRVHTHESVYTELTLTNETLLIQEYGFLNLPAFMEIQPNHGFGTILPGETIKLHLIYSACLTDIPENDTGANGLDGERRFQIQVVSLSELARHKKQINIDRLNNSNMKSMVPRNRGVPPSITMIPKVSKATSEMIDQQQNELNNSSNNMEIDSLNENNPDTEEIIDTSPEDHFINNRKEKNVVDTVVHIVDTFCELSEQIIEFPPTPCGSFSMVSVVLRGFNMASHPRCTCGIVKNQDKEFTAHYELKCSSSPVKVLPQRGLLKNKDTIKIDFIFEPKLPRSAVLEKSSALVTENLEEKSQEDKPQKKRKQGERKIAKKEREVEKEGTSDVDKLADEINSWETFEPKVSTIFVTCQIDLETKNGEKRDELLFAKLICPVTRPDILILSEHREIDFGPTAIGLSPRKFLLIKNISNKSVKVDVNILDPFGPFFVPPGKAIETGSILKLPVTFSPTEDHPEEAREYFEVCSIETRTRWRVKVMGRAVVPSYVLRPRSGVARFEIIDGKPVELKISIQNTGVCPLVFRLRPIDFLEGYIPGVQKESRVKSSKKLKKKGGADGDSGRKSPRKPMYSDFLESHEELAIFGRQLERAKQPECFSLRNFDENMRLLVPERQKVEFAVRFQPPKKEEISAKKEVAKESPRRKKRTKESPERDEVQKLNYCHVAVLKLTLGSSMLVQDLVMICSIR